MPTSRWIAPLIAVSIVLPAFSLAAVASEEPNRLFVRNTPAQFLVGDPSRESANYQLQVLVEGDNQGELVVEYVDTLIVDGAARVFPAGTLETSLVNAIRLVPIDLKYVPNGRTQNFDLEFAGNQNLKPLLYSGAIRISFVPDGEDSASAALSAGVSKSLLVAQFGVELEGGAEEFLAIRLLESTVKSIARSSFIDSLLPDIPGVVNTGPIDARVTFDNPGQYPLDTAIEWEFFEGDELLARKKLEQGLIYRGNSRTIEAQSIFVDPVTGRSINVLPSVGFVTVRITLTSALVGRELPAVIKEHTVLIAPWKEVTAVIFLLVLLQQLYRRYKKRFLSSQAEEVSEESQQSVQ